MKEWTERLLGYDTETTGVGPDARIIEFGAVLIENGHVVTSWNILMEPQGVDWNSSSVRKALEINQITREDLKGRKTFAQEFDTIRSALMQSNVRVGHNVRFDGRMLANEFRLAVARGELSANAVAGTKGIVTLDTLGLDVYLNPKAVGRKLEDVAARWGVYNWQKHRAIGDADASIRILLNMSEQLPDSLAVVAKISSESYAQWESKFKKPSAQPHP